MRDIMAVVNKADRLRLIASRVRVRELAKQERIQTQPEDDRLDCADYMSKPLSERLREHEPVI
jgi:hypothetical protein